MLLSGNGTPKGAARLRVGDAVFLKTIRGSWLHGTVVCLLDTGFGLSGPGLAGIRRIDYRDVTEIQKLSLIHIPSPRDLSTSRMPSSA